MKKRNRQIIYLLVCVAALLSAAVSCGDGKKLQGKFEVIDSMSDIDAQKAMSMLDSIDYASLPERERHRYDLLRIKTNDKAYVMHTSDSLVLDVIDYYADHQEEGLYPEALYYGGRVYSDMGDFPTAIDYFQKALDVIPDDKESLQLKCRTLSQTGRLLDELMLHSQSIPYIDEAIKIERALNDSLRLVYDELLISKAYLYEDNIQEGRCHIDNALRYSVNIPEEDKAWIKVQKTDILLAENKVDSALIVIRENLPLVDSLCYNYALANAANIYKINGILDTTYMYAKKLANREDFNNRLTGFDILFSNELRGVVPYDTLLSYISNYKQYIDEYLDRYKTDETVLRHSKYNYDLHVREREKAEIEKLWITVISVIVILCSIIAILYYRVRSLKSYARMKMAVQIVERIQWNMMVSDIIKKSEDNEDIFSVHVDYHKLKALPFFKESNKKNLKLELMTKLASVTDTNSGEPSVDEELLKSSVLKRIKKNIAQNKGIGQNQSIRNALEREIMSSCPDFKKHLMILSDNKMNSNEYEVALLIRAGLSPKDISILLARTKSAITDRRSSLAKKIFGVPGKNAELDRIILRL